MQRLFTTFPGGSPGLGLLLLRLAVAAALAADGVACLADGRASLGAWAVGALAGITGSLLVLGLLTPLSGATAAATVAGVALALLPSPRGQVFGDGATAFAWVLAAAALALIGPGAFSVDAALFGRREITIPPAERRRD